MRKTILVSLPSLAILSLLLVPATYAAGQSQIVLSCSTPPPQADGHPAKPCVSSETVTTPPIISGGTLYFIGGFWIWCQNPNGGTPYGPDCTGSMYIEEINLGTGVGVYQSTSVSGGAATCSACATGVQVTVTTSDADMSCTFDVPTAPTNGGTNTLSGFCDGVPITFSNMIVHVT